MQNDEQMPDLDLVISDFNLEQENIPDILIPDGDYAGNISSIRWNDNGGLDFNVTFEEDGRLMSDEKTSVGGQSLTYSIWFPVEGDEKKPSKKAGVSKRQSKIKMVARALNALKITANTKADLDTLIQSNTLIGMSVVASVKAEIWKGMLLNKITTLVVV